jgi:hypothetical protein
MEHISMRKGSVFALLTAGAALSLSLAAAPAAFAVTAPAPVPASHGGPGGGGPGGGGGGGGRPGGQPVTSNGVGSLGTPWHLKSMHDDVDATGAQVVGEEFEIDAPDPQNWTITLTDNGISFPFTETTAADSLTVNGMTANQPGTQHLTATATDSVTGERILATQAFVDLPPLAG